MLHNTFLNMKQRAAQIVLRPLHIALVAGLLLPLQALAAEVEVTWHEPSSYRDIQAAGSNQSNFEQRVMEAFDAKFAELAAQLPADQRLHITVTNVDLAGTVVMRDVGGTMQEYRYVRHMDFPYMELSYTLYDADGSVLQQGEEKIKGREVPGQGLQTSQRRRGTNMLEYESVMLDRWFKETFEQS